MTRFVIGMPAHADLSRPAYLAFHCCRIADRFRRGDGPARDYNLALRWYRLAAERGHPGGQYNLARMYDQGLGVRRAADVAARWYQRAAVQGEVHSQHHLAEMYRDGRGVVRDDRESLRWLDAAARQGRSDRGLLAQRTGQVRQAGGGKCHAGVGDRDVIGVADAFGDMDLAAFGQL